MSNAKGDEEDRKPTGEPQGTPRRTRPCLVAVEFKSSARGSLSKNSTVRSCGPHFSDRAVVTLRRGKGRIAARSNVRSGLPAKYSVGADVFRFGPQQRTSLNRVGMSVRCQEADAPLRSVCHAMWAMLRAAVGTATDQPATQKSVPARLPERKLSECELLHITPVRAALDKTNGPESQLIFDKYYPDAHGSEAEFPVSVCSGNAFARSVE
jgi:hypothetical protein